MDVKDIFDTSFCEVTKKLVKLELKKVCDEEGKEEDKEECQALLTDPFLNLLNWNIIFFCNNRHICCWILIDIISYLKKLILHLLHAGLT